MEGKVKFELVCSEEEIDFLKEALSSQPRLFKAMKIIFVKSKDELLDLVCAWFSPADSSFFTASQVCEFICNVESIEASPEMVGRALTLAGFASKTIRIGKEVKKVYFAEKI